MKVTMYECTEGAKEEEEPVSRRLVETYEGVDEVPDSNCKEARAIRFFVN